jgi:hypothetical protein
VTKKFNVFYTCKWCGKQTEAQTGFGTWMRDHTCLDSGSVGIVRTDTDHWILRYKTNLDGRGFQLLMLVEVKEYGAEPDPAQLDILRFVHIGITRKRKNMHGAKTCDEFTARSAVSGRIVHVRYMGYHLLQFEKTNPNDSSWIKWNRKPVTAEELVGILSMERRPDRPDKFTIEYLRDRHRKNKQPTFQFVKQMDGTVLSS